MGSSNGPPHGTNPLPPPSPPPSALCRSSPSLPRPSSHLSAPISPPSPSPWPSLSPSLPSPTTGIPLLIPTPLAATCASTSGSILSLHPTPSIPLNTSIQTANPSSALSP